MLWRMPADLHEQRIGVISSTHALFAYPQPATSVLATKVSPRQSAVPKSLAETAQTAEIGLAVHSMGETAKLRTGGSVADFGARPLDLDGQRSQPVLARRAIACLGSALQDGRGIAQRARADRQRAAFQAMRGGGKCREVARRH